MLKYLTRIFRRPSYTSDLTKLIEDYNEINPRYYYEQVHSRRIYWYGEIDPIWLADPNKSVINNQELNPTHPKNL
ncbi:MAG: hypothetical protein QM520_06910 [Gammaproteobacteria bacterium]|nr:hypothetical protein [Gammaproteobacteria bacterium]